MNIYNRKSVSDDLNKYDILAKPHSFVEVTEWANGEGWDITFDDRIISLSMGQLDAINYLTKALEVEK